MIFNGLIHWTSVLTIVLMAAATYLTRIVGFLALRNRTLSKRAVTVMEAAPGCVLISVIAPDFVADKPADLAALAITLLAATRLSMLPTVLIGVVSAGLLRYLLGRTRQTHCRAEPTLGCGGAARPRGRGKPACDTRSQAIPSAA